MLLKQIIYSFRKLFKNIWTDVSSVLQCYRYLSLFITSIFYLLGPPDASLVVKLSVVICLFVSARIVLGLYEAVDYTSDGVKNLIIVETLGIALVLVPTGGLNSPFIWYALNPVLVAAYVLPFYFSWANVTFYLLTSGMAVAVLQGRDVRSTLPVLAGNTDKVLVFVLVTVAVQIIFHFVKQLEEQSDVLNKQKEELVATNERLKEARKVAEDSLKHKTALYQTVEAFCSQDEPEHMAEYFAYYTSILTGDLPAVFWLAEDASSNHGQDTCSFYAFDTTADQEFVFAQLKEIWSKMSEENNSWEKTSQTVQFDSMLNMLYVPVKSFSKLYGIIAVVIQCQNSNSTGMPVEKNLCFLADLSAVVMERCSLEKEADRLILLEEQNRIAEEMHDSVSQRLFSIACAAHVVSTNLNVLSQKELYEKIQAIKISASAASKELRSSIYSLSSRKRGEDFFEDSLAAYLENLSELNGVEVDFDINGSEDLFTPDIKKVIYRTIREATGNAIRHGYCSSIAVKLSVIDGSIELSVQDDGMGFNPCVMDSNESSGLGLKNIRKNG